MQKWRQIQILRNFGTSFFIHMGCIAFNRVSIEYYYYFFIFFEFSTIYNFGTPFIFETRERRSEMEIMPAVILRCSWIH